MKYEYFIHLPMKMEPTVSSETSAIRTQMLGNYPKKNTLHLGYDESLKTRKNISTYSKYVPQLQSMCKVKTVGFSKCWLFLPDYTASQPKTQNFWV